MSLIAELRTAWRRAGARPGSSLLALAVLAVGVGACAFMFAVIQAAQRAPLPFRDGERLVQLSYRSTQHDGWESIYAADYAALAARRDVFDSLGGFQNATISLSDAQGAERFAGARLTPGLFTALGLTPMLGRDLDAGDLVPGAPRAVLLGEDLWRTRFNADPTVLGRAVKVNQQAGVIVGVMPAGMAFPFEEQLWMPVDDPAGEQARREGQRLNVLGHVKPGVSIEAALDALAPTYAAEVAAAPEVHAGYTLQAMPAALYFVDPQSRSFQDAMFAAVVGLLLIAIANAAAIATADTLARRHELAVRAALGASRLRLVAGEAAQAVLFALAACALALVGAAVGLDWLQAAAEAAEDPLPYWIHFKLTPATFVFALAAAAVATLAARVGAAWPATGRAVQYALRDGERGSAGRGAARVVGWLLAAQVALSVCLVVATAVLGFGIAAMWNRDLGADPRGVLTARIGLLGEAYETDAARNAFFTRLETELAALPGVQAAGVGSALPGSIHDEDGVATETWQPGDVMPLAAWGAVNVGYRDSMRLRLVAGRWFDARDSAAAPAVAVIDRAFAARHWPDREPLGQRFKLEPENEDSPWRTVVGVIEPLLLAEVDDVELPALLVPLAQEPRRFVTVTLRTGADPESLAPALRAAVRALDPDAPVYWVRSHEAAVAHGRSMAELIATLFGAAGGIALLLAAAGAYGVVAGTVGRRVREIGLRRALGAGAWAVTRAVAAGPLGRVAVGLSVGLVAAVPIGRGFAALAPGVLPFDARVLASVVLAVTVVALLGVAAPVRRALAIQPAEALRDE